MEGVTETRMMAEGAFVSPQLKAVPIPEMGGGKGVVATRKIAPYTLVASIPLKLILTAKSARRDVLISIGGVSRGIASQLTPVEAITSALVHLRTSSLPTSSLWSIWARALPQQYDNLLECSPLEMKNFALPRYRAKVQLEQRRAAATFDRLVQKKVFSNVKGDVTFQTYLWAYNSLMSRGFAFDDEVWAMCPFVDYFNFSNEPNIHADYDRSSCCYTFSTGRNGVSKRQQLLLRYGCYTDFELALWYGFALCSPVFLKADFSPTHQVECAYCLPPFVGPDGDFDEGTNWANDLAERALGMETLLSQRQLSELGQLQSCRFGRGWISPSMGRFVDILSAAVSRSGATISASDVMRRIVSAELATLDSATTSSTENVSCQPREHLLTCVAADSIDLLLFVQAMDDAQLKAMMCVTRGP